MKFSDIRQISYANYRVNVAWTYLEDWLADMDERVESLPGLRLDLDPDFQRGHVWTTDKQIKYVEFVLRGGQSSRELLFNCPGWQGTYDGPMELVDGKQRLESVRLFLRDELPAFGTLYSEFEDRLNVMRPDFIIYVNNLPTRAEVLQWYLDLNDGGVVHTQDELDKVREMLTKELG